jgi:hypothetical protein
MEIKFDINRLVDRLCNAERTVGEQGDIIRDLEKRLSLQSEELSFEKQAKCELIAVKEVLEKELKSEQENATFWYNKALELGWDRKTLFGEIPPEEGEFAHGA